MILKNRGFFIYRLLKDNKVVYVGQTTNVIHRVFTHKSEKFGLYDSVFIREVDDENSMNIEEFKEIVKYKPILNKDLPSIPYSLRETRVKSVISCLIDSNIDPNDYYDIEKPDMKINLNGKVFKLWAKNGFEEQFSKQFKEEKND